MVPGAAYLLVAFAATGPHDGGAHLTGVPPSGAPVTLDWSADGKLVLVGSRWLLDPSKGTFRARGSASASSATVDGTAREVAEGQFALSFRLTPRTTFTQSFDRASDAPPSCRVRTGTGRGTRPRGGCLDPELSYLARVEVGPAGFLALLSSAEGHAAVQFVRYDPRRGQSDTKARTLVIEGSSAVRVRFAPDGASAALISPCRLDGPPPILCEDPDRAAHWRQYELPLEGGPAEFVRADLPPGAVLHPARNRYAWVAGGSVCVGEPTDKAARCWPLPASH